MKKGDYLITKRQDRDHHGLYVGDGKVIHYVGPSSGREKGVVELIPLATFIERGELRVKYPTFRVYEPTESVERAYSRLGCSGNGPFFGNGEQFVNWCLFGVKYTRQVVSGLGYVSVPVSRKERKSRASVLEPAWFQIVGSGCGAALVPVSQSQVAGLVAGTCAWATSSAIASGLLPGGWASSDLFNVLALPLALGVTVGVAVKKFWDWL